jgi:hypothetical protein
MADNQHAFSRPKHNLCFTEKKDRELPVGYVSMGYVLGNYRFGGEVADVPPFAFESKKGH